jgi:hypothetical protein
MRATTADPNVDIVVDHRHSESHEAQPASQLLAARNTTPIRATHGEMDPVPWS